MFCSFCGGEVKDGEKFCMSCGTSVAMMNVAKVTPAEGPAAPVVETPVVEAPVVEAPVVEAAPAVETAPVVEPAVETPAPASETPASDASEVVGGATVGVAAAMTAGSSYFEDTMQSMQTQIPTPAYAQPINASTTSAYTPVSGASSNIAAATSQNTSSVQAAYSQAAAQNSYSQPAYAQPAYAQPASNYGQPAYSQNSYSNNNAVAASQAATPILVLGIVSVATACTFYFSFVGIICGIIGLVKYSSVSKMYGFVPAKGKVGKGLSLGGLIFSGILTFICFIAIIGIIADSMFILF